MTKFVFAVVMFATVFAQASVVLVDNKNTLPAEVAEKLIEGLEKKCSASITQSSYVTVDTAVLRFEKIDQGVIDYFYDLELTAHTNGDEYSTQKIKLTMSIYAVNNPPDEWKIETIDADGECK